MQNAPSVVYPVGHSAFYRLLIVALGVLGVAAIAGGWIYSVAQSPSNALHLRWKAGLLISVLWTLFALRTFQRAEIGRLRWDSQAPPSNLDDRPGAWFWVSDRSKSVLLSASPERIFDGQSRVLLRLQGIDGGHRWAWTEQSQDPVKWDDFRRALVAGA